jgi:hypothetical protein
MIPVSQLIAVESPHERVERGDHAFAPQHPAGRSDCPTAGAFH